MDFRVRQVQQNASGGSYVVVYEGDLDLVHGDSRIEVAVLDTEPADADPSLVRQAVDAIRRGIERVLSPEGTGATFRIRSLVIHASDFKTWRFETATVEGLRTLLGR
jgi:hypothetical protein